MNSLSHLSQFGQIQIIESHVKLIEYMGAAYYIVLNRVINFATNNSVIIGSTKNKHTRKLLYTIKN